MGDQALTNQPIPPDMAIFVEASPEQRKIAWRLNGEVWAAPMSIDDYISRETYLSEQDLSREGRCTYRVLFRKGDPQHIVASCESTKKRVLIAGRGQGFREGFGYGIASIYTNPKHRRLGMAALMLKRLQDVIDKDSDCSVLYSDIGRQYYSNLGWSVFPAEQATLYLLPGGDFKISQPGRTKFVTKEEIRPLCDRDVADLTARFRGMADNARMHVAFVPDYAQIAWQLAREEFMARAMYKKDVQNRGAITDDACSWVYWDHDWHGKKLKVQRIITPESASAEQRAADMTALLEAALAEAKAWGLQKVLVWNPDETMTRGIKEVGNIHETDVPIIFDERSDGSIPSFRWVGGKDVSNTVWEENFYYCWC